MGMVGGSLFWLVGLLYLVVAWQRRRIIVVGEKWKRVELGGCSGDYGCGGST